MNQLRILPILLSLLFGVVGILNGPLPAQDLSKRVENHQIPSPRPNGWITDLTKKISAESITHVNMVCEEIHDRLGREMCVVVVDTIGMKSNPGPGNPHRKFATGLFNLWGVGKQGFPGFSGEYRDNGVLLFVALDDRAAELILGNGIDDREKERIADQIMQNVVVENFMNDDPSSAVYEGIRAVGTRIFSVKDLDSPNMLPSVSVSGRKIVKGNRRHRQRGVMGWLPTAMPFLLGGGLLGCIGLVIGGRYYLRHRPRVCPKCSQNMIRLEEEQDDLFLEEPEQVEEWLGSVDYDVWGCAPCEEVIKVRYGKLFTRYSKCPSCWYITVLKVEDVLRRANYTVGGIVRVSEDCKSCNYQKTYNYRTPKRVKSSSSGSSFGSSSGGGSFGGSSSGFGGGRSSGGGASGRW